MTRIRTSVFLPAVLAAVIPLVFLNCAGFTAVNRTKPRLAILPFTGGSPEDAEAIAEFFSYEADINRVFTPVPRTSAIETLMKEQQFQRSGLTDSDTIAELGRQLNADYVLAGHIAVLGSAKLLLITIIDVQELQQIAGDYREYQRLGSAVDDILPDMAKRIAEAAGRRAGSRKRPRLAVLPFNVLSSGMDEGDAELLAQLLATELANSGAYAVFPRTRAIEKVMEEHSIERKGMTDPESIRVIGAAVNAQYVLSANVRNIEGDNYFSASILHIEEATQGRGTREKYQTVNDGLILMPKIAQTLTGRPASGRNASAPSEVSAGQLDGVRLQQAYAAYRKLLRESGSNVTQFRVLEVNTPVNMYGQTMLSCQVIKIDINGNGRWDDDIDGTIWHSYTSQIFHHVKKGDVICLPVKEIDLMDEIDPNGIAAAGAGQAADTSEGGDSGLPDLTPVKGKKFKPNVRYFRTSQDLYENALKPIVVFRSEDARYREVEPTPEVFNVRSFRDRNSVLEFLSAHGLGGNNPHIYEAHNVMSIDRIWAVNGVPVEFMEELSAAEKARLAQDAWENSERIGQIYAQNAR
jgi:TolB-like protein